MALKLPYPQRDGLLSRLTIQTKEECVKYLGEKPFLILSTHFRNNYLLRGYVRTIYKSLHISKVPQNFHLQLFISLWMTLKEAKPYVFHIPE